MGNVKRVTDTTIEKKMKNHTNGTFAHFIHARNTNISGNIVKVAWILPMLLFCIIGCSEVPYTGPVLTVDSVDRYLNSVGEDTICLQDGFDSICLKVVEDDSQTQPPIVQVHPTSIVFLFYYEDRPILRAEKVMNTSALIQELVDSGQVQLPPKAASSEGAADNPAETDTSGEWIIHAYYPDGFPEKDRGATLETSGLEIRVGEEKQLSNNPADDLEILNFKQIDDPNGIPGVQFTVTSEDTDISIAVNGIIDAHTALFYVKADGTAADKNIYTFQLQPNDDL